MKVILAPLGWLYGSVMALRRWLYRRGILESHQLPGVVISVGNLEVGGTGKSPVVMALAAELLRLGARPAILTRGYRSGLAKDDCVFLQGSRIVQGPQSGQSFHADEATMQAQRLGTVPVIIGQRRWQAARKYLEKFPSDLPTHWILDDGFQHLKLRRQLDIVLLNAAAPFADQRCLPAGRLREFPSTLQVAQAILLTRSVNGSIPSQVQTRSAPGTSIIPVTFTEGEPKQLAGPPRAFQENRSLALALGIAHPQRVVEFCQTRRFPVTKHLFVRDHEVFPADQLRTLVADADALLTTEKDFWRQPSVWERLQKPVFVLPLELRFPAAQGLSKILADFTDS